MMVDVPYTWLMSPIHTYLDDSKAIKYSPLSNVPFQLYLAPPH